MSTQNEVRISPVDYVVRALKGHFSEFNREYLLVVVGYYALKLHGSRVDGLVVIDERTIRLVIALFHALMSWKVPSEATLEQILLQKDIFCQAFGYFPESDLELIDFLQLSYLLIIFIGLQYSFYMYYKV